MLKSVNKFSNFADNSLTKCFHNAFTDAGLDFNENNIQKPLDCKWVVDNNLLNINSQNFRNITSWNNLKFTKLAFLMTYSTNKKETDKKNYNTIICVHIDSPDPLHIHVWKPKYNGQNIYDSKQRFSTHPSCKPHYPQQQDYSTRTGIVISKEDISFLKTHNLNLKLDELLDIYTQLKSKSLELTTFGFRTMKNAKKAFKPITVIDKMTKNIEKFLTSMEYEPFLNSSLSPFEKQIIDLRSALSHSEYNNTNDVQLKLKQLDNLMKTYPNTNNLSKKDTAHFNQVFRNIEKKSKKYISEKDEKYFDEKIPMQHQNTKFLTDYTSQHNHFKKMFINNMSNLKPIVICDKGANL